MKHRFSLLVLILLLLNASDARAQSPLGAVVASFPYNAASLLADPIRHRVYAADSSSNSVVIIDTDALAVIATVPTGTNPVDMAISPDDNTLYIANLGSAAEAIGVLDLATLTARPSLALPEPAAAVAAGLGGRVYATAHIPETGESAIYQIDGTTGTIQATLDKDDEELDGLRITPDGKTLFAASDYVSVGTFYSYDVSTITPAALQTVNGIGGEGNTLVVSHHGDFFYLSGLYSTSNPITYAGTFNVMEPGRLAFSPDDLLVYELGVNFPAPILDIFDTRTFSKLSEVTVPTIDTIDYGDKFGSIAVENTGSYVFLADSSFNGATTTGRILVLGTGRGTLTPPLPTLNIDATVDQVTAGSGGQASITITRTGDLSQKLAVAYAIKGTAQNGTDYFLLSGKKNIKANKASAKILISPAESLSGFSPKTVKLVLQPGATYQLGDDTKAKVKIYFYNYSD